jgi:hypothetical protein
MCDTSSTGSVSMFPCFHVSIADRCPGRGRADVGFPFGIDHEVQLSS